MSVIQIKQPKVMTWLQHTIEKDRLAHAYLFTGKKGTGKKEMALLFAQCLFCLKRENGLPCLQCNECIRVQHHNHPDVLWIEPEGLSIKIDQVRDLHKQFSYRAQEKDYKVYIIDAVDTLTVQASNSLLKFLEDPYPGTIAILLTSQKQVLLPTLLSRCQEIPFLPPTPDDLIKQLEPEYGRALSHAAAHLTADLDEAKQLCQSEWFAELRSLMIQLTEELDRRPTHQLTAIPDRWLLIAKEREQIDVGLELLLLWYKDILYQNLQLGKSLTFADQAVQANKHAQAWPEERITVGMEAILQAKRRLYANVNPQLLLEQLMLRLMEG